MPFRPSALIRLCLLAALSIIHVSALAQTPPADFVGTWDSEIELGKTVKISFVFELSGEKIVGFALDPDGTRAQLSRVMRAGQFIFFRLDRSEGSFLIFDGKLAPDGTLGGGVIVMADGVQRGKSTWKARKAPSGVTAARPATPQPSAPSAGGAPRPPAAQQAYDRGVPLFRSGDFAGAAAAFTECLGVSPRDTGCLYFRGLSHHRGRKYKEAVADLTSVIQFSPKAPAQIYVDRAMARIEIEEFDGAVTDSDTALGMQGPAEAYLSRGRARYKKAVDERMSSIILVKPELEREAFALADKALADYEKFISLKPQDYRGYYHRGELFYARWNVFDDSDVSYVARAVEELTKAIGFDPQDAGPYYARAEAYRVLGESDLAAADERKASALSMKR